MPDVYLLYLVQLQVGATNVMRNTWTGSIVGFSVLTILSKIMEALDGSIQPLRDPWMDCSIYNSNELQ